MIVIGFKAVATDDFGKEYDASFYYGFPENANPIEVQQFEASQLSWFSQNHKNGRILGKVQKQILR